MILSYYIGSKYLSSFFWSFLSIFFLILLVDGSDQVVSMSSQGHSFILGLKYGDEGYIGVLDRVKIPSHAPSSHCATPQVSTFA